MKAPSLLAEARAARFSGVLPPDLLNSHPVAVIGTGAIGAMIARLLVSMGVNRITLVDGDTVALENLGTQGWFHGDLGQPKVQALSHDLRNRNPEVKVVCLPEMMTADRLKLIPATAAVFLCVDNMEARRLIVTSLWARKRKPQFLVDTRMGLETGVTIPITDQERYDHYLSEWFPQHKAYAAPCTAQATYYTAAKAGSRAVECYAHWLRGSALPVKVHDGMLEAECQFSLHGDR